MINRAQFIKMRSIKSAADQYGLLILNLCFLKYIYVRKQNICGQTGTVHPGSIPLNLLRFYLQKVSGIKFF